MKKINYYIASHFGNRLMLQVLIERLKQKYPNLKNISSWIDRKSNTTFYLDVEKDFKEIDECDFLIAVYPWGDGTKCEISYAMGLQKPIIALIDNISLPSLKNLPVKQYSEFFPLVKFTHTNLYKKDPFVIVSDIDLFYRSIHDVTKMIGEK